ncbi:dihydroorotase [Flammeovirgaceae bacterium SG7u.111]|nr:dihydroorotase [Flammeovirgaceae bacterium SG7u.132]WPO33815.1 dihydroorotase [Flammeovirgaceae bacterium SG7u.111]
MEILLENIKLIGQGHPFHLQQVNILIKDGTISSVSQEQLKTEGKVIGGSALSVSAGWFDMQAMLNEPGLEFKEDIDSLCAAAAAGGFTDVAVMPNTQPIIQSKESLHFIKSRNTFHSVKLHGMAAVTKDTKGEELTEMIDLTHAGAVAFTDGDHTLGNASVMSRAMLYLKAFDGVLINRAEERALASGGHMHEGIVSTSMGTKGRPALAEEMNIQRDLALVAYHDAKLHFSNISTAKSVELIRQAKKDGLNVTCDVAAHQMAFTDEDLASFDSNLKVRPPFRSKADVAALWEGLADGTIDIIVSAHNPQDEECKELEFDLADFGIINLETAFAALNTHRPDSIPLEVLVEKFTTAPRKLLKLDAVEIAEGQPACLTIFDENAFWSLKEQDIKSKSRNTPFLGKMLKGKPMGIINRGQVSLAPELR